MSRREEEIERRVMEWHAHGGWGIELYEHLGMTEEQYHAWVVDPETALLDDYVPGLPNMLLCDCESMGGRFGGHRASCPWRIAFEAAAAAESVESVEEPESYHDRRDRNYMADAARRANLLDPEHRETEGEYAAVLNREDELDEGEGAGESWNTTVHEVVVRFRWSESSRYTEGAMESIEMVDGDPIGTAIDAFLEPHYDTDTFEVLSKTHTTEHEED